jgi:two-component system NtrC family sensor kinase
MQLEKTSACYPCENDNPSDIEFDFYGVLDSIAVPIFIKDTTGIYTNCNKAYEKFMGLNRDEIIGKSVYHLAPKNLADIYYEKDKELLEQGLEQIYESMITTKGMTRYVIFHKSIYRNATDDISGLVGVIIDITEQKQAEKLLQERIAFEKIVSTISADCLKTSSNPDELMLSALNLISRFIKVTNSYIFIISNNGKSVEQVYHWNATVDDSIILNMNSPTQNLSTHWKIIKGIVQELDNTQEPTTHFELHSGQLKRMVFPLKNGREWLGAFNLEWEKDQYVELRNEHTTLLRLLVEVFVSMLQRKRTEEFLRVSEEKNKALLEAIPDVMAVVTPDFKIVDFKIGKAFEHFQYIGENDFFIGKTVSEVVPEDVAMLFMENIILAFQTRRVTGFEYQIEYNQEIRYREARGIVISDGTALVMIRDITDKKLMEETLKKRNVEIKEALANLEQTQMHLVEQEKLAGIGQLAAGVAHEINNPLGFVLSNFDSLKQYLTKITDVYNKYRDLKIRVLDSDVQELKELAEQIIIFEKQKKIAYIFEDLGPIIQESDDGLKRLSEIVKALKLFSRVDKSSEFENYDLNTGIRNTLIIAKNEIKYVAEIELDLRELPEIQASSGQINQVLLNIIINAAYAIKEKQSDKMGMIKIASNHDDQFVYCSIKDNGLGMSEETLKNIFNAFFTTKPIGEGTGLGLSISYDIIVNKHCGDISVTSEKGIGTTFIIKLPLVISPLK